MKEKELRQGNDAWATKNMNNDKQTIKQDKTKTLVPVK